MTEYVLATISVLSAIGVITLKKPVHACLSFLLTLIMLSAMYLQLAAPFIAVMQVLVYAGAILVIFMFVIILFQDAYLQIGEKKAESSLKLRLGAIVLFLLGISFLGSKLAQVSFTNTPLPNAYGSAEALGRTLYIDFFFPFEAVGLLFLIAAIGALYIGRRRA